MHQQWLTVIGLGADFLGFCLLLREWWLAFFNEARQLEMEVGLEKMRAMRDFGRGHRPPTEPNPYASLERAQDDMAIRKARSAHRATLAARKSVFVLAMTLIVAGFLLQIAGAIPGCCPPWVAPQVY